MLSVVLVFKRRQWSQSIVSLVVIELEGSPLQLLPRPCQALMGSRGYSSLTLPAPHPASAMSPRSLGFLSWEMVSQDPPCGHGSPLLLAQSSSWVSGEQGRECSPVPERAHNVS